MTFEKQKISEEEERKYVEVNITPGAQAWAVDESRAVKVAHRGSDRFNESREEYWLFFHEGNYYYPTLKQAGYHREGDQGELTLKLVKLTQRFAGLKLSSKELPLDSWTDEQIKLFEGGAGVCKSYGDIFPEKSLGYTVTVRMIIDQGDQDQSCQAKAQDEHQVSWWSGLKNVLGLN